MSSWHPEKLSSKGNWQEFECPACGALTASWEPINELAEFEKNIAERACSKFFDDFDIDDPTNWFDKKYMCKRDEQYWKLRGLLEQHPTVDNLVRINES